MPITKASVIDVPELNVLVNSAYRGEESKKGWTSEADMLDGLRIDEDMLKTYFDNKAITARSRVVFTWKLKDRNYTWVCSAYRRYYRAKG
jgi:hypothetical protein